MKKVEAIIRPVKLEDVKTALVNLLGDNVDVGIISEVRGLGRQNGSSEIEGGYQYYSADFVPKVSLWVVVLDDLVDSVISTILSHAKTGKPGDGKILVTSIEGVVQIKTGESGDAVL